MYFLKLFRFSCDHKLAPANMKMNYDPVVEKIVNLVYETNVPELAFVLAMRSSNS